MLTTKISHFIFQFESPIIRKISFLNKVSKKLQKSYLTVKKTRHKVTLKCQKKYVKLMYNENTL